jgi:hypothetical protein
MYQINKSTNSICKDLFDFMRAQESEIESSFGGKLVWERMDEKVSCRIDAKLYEVNVFDKEDGEKIIDFLVDTSKEWKQPSEIQ